jgi:5'-methylthioadenosine phosphorylase
MESIKIGVIGGSGVYELSNVKVKEEIEVKTPFGKPSDKITLAEIGKRMVAFIPRHGKGHRHLPTEVPSKANIYALKSLGVQKVIAVSAVGSLKEEIRPTDLVVPSQIIDRTKSRPLSYFGGGVVGHISFADPFCNHFRKEIKALMEKYIAENKLSKRLFTEETYLCMEGPQFSTRAESHLYRSWGAGVIGMTAIPEAKLAREAELCYAMIALPTDYDCWREGEAAVDVSLVLEYMKENNKTINSLLPFIIESIALDEDCSCRKAAQYAVMTGKGLIPEQIKKDLDLFYGKYWK